MEPGEQLSDLCCPICFSCFSEKDNIPHMLKCGHTHCDQCLKSLMRRGDGKCGECRTQISSASVKSLPINYSILRLIEAMRSKEMKHNEFQVVEEKIENIMKTLCDTQELYRTRMRDLHKKVEDLEVEKAQMKDTKQGLQKRCIDLGKSKSLDESLAIIKTTVDKMKEIDRQASFINERLQKGHNLDCLQSLYDAPEEYLINYRPGLFSKCFSLNQKIYMQCSRHEPPLHKHVLNYHDLHPFMVGSFFVVEYSGRASMLEFSLFRETNRSKAFVQLCAGAQSEFSYIGYSFGRPERAGREGESVVVSRKAKDDTKAVPKNLNKSARKVSYIRSGYLEGVGPELATGTQFKVYFEDWPCRKSQLCFGTLVKGASILRAALKNKFEVTVTECGLIFDAALKL